MKQLLILLLIWVLLLCACDSNSNGPNQTNDQTNTSTEEEQSGDKEGEEMMDERLITKEELFEYIQTHNVGLTIEDFKGIDVEDFISYCYFTTSSIRQLSRKSLDDYLEELEWRVRISFFAKEKFSVDSSDEEYQKFLNDFFKAINKDVIASYFDDQSGFYRYELAGKEYLYISRTKDIDQIAIGTNPIIDLELLVAFIPHGDARIRENFCYSRNKKYMLLADPLDDQLFEYVKVFCEIND